MKGSRSVLAFDLAHGFCAHTGRKIGGGCAFSEPIGQPGQGALKVGARDVLHEVNGAAAPVLGDVVEPLPSFGPWARVMLNPSAFQRSGSALSCWKPRASKTSGSGNARILSAVAFCCTSAFGALTLPALLIGRRLGRLLGGAITRPCAHGRRTGRLVGRWPRPAHRPICRGSARRAAAPQSQA